MGPDDRRKCERRALCHRRRAAGHAGTKVGSHHQRFFGSGPCRKPHLVRLRATKFAVRAIAEGLRQEESPVSGIRSTIISPGMVETELLNTVTSPEVKQMGEMIRGMSISPDRIARAIAYAIDQPDDTSVNEIMIRPTVQAM